jgi:hypothetical protein
MRLNNHLFFTEDSLLFGKANVFEWFNVPEILQVYMQASGQKLNHEKTSLFFNKNTQATTKQHILSIEGLSSTFGMGSFPVHGQDLKEI